MNWLAGTLLMCDGVMSLAQADLKAIKQHVNDSRIDPAMLMVVIGLLLALIGLIAWRHHKSAGKRTASPDKATADRRLFHAVAERVGLSKPQVKLLAQVARHTGLNTPASLLLSADTLAHYGRQYIDALAQSQITSLNPRAEQRRLDALSQTLFDRPMHSAGVR